MSGTSMASPHVAGAAALLVNCGYSASQIRSVLDSTADDLGAAGRDNEYGYGLLDVEEAASCGSGVATPTPTPSGPAPITEGFESGNWSGGTGWTSAWSLSGSSSYTTLLTSSSPQSGSWHARLRANGTITRPFSLSGYSSATLTFWAKASSWENGDGAAVQVSTNGSNWTNVLTFVNGFDNNSSYQQQQVNLNAYAGQGTVYLRFQGQMSSSADYFYIDSIDVSGTGVKLEPDIDAFPTTPVAPTPTSTPVTPTATSTNTPIPPTATNTTVPPRRPTRPSHRRRRTHRYRRRRPNTTHPPQRQHPPSPGKPVSGLAGCSAASQTGSTPKNERATNRSPFAIGIAFGYSRQSAAS